ncbi:MAG TPA: hypothetical protein DD434_02205 [Bacteroidales bacterium]|nr:hypothetical protein [Bacteroidales bacterium]
MKNLILFIFFSVLTNNLYCQIQSNFKLSQDDLLSINYYDSTYREKVNGDTLSKYINIEFITKEEFNRNKIEEENYFDRDTLAIRKDNGVIRLNCIDTVVKYIDNDDDGDRYCQYEYFGQIPFMNKYVVSGYFYEWINCFLVDKDSGKETVLFDTPLISPNKKHIISFSYNPYLNVIDFQLFSISGNDINLITELHFSGWNTTQKNNFFWGKDNSFYLEVINPENYEEINDIYYIKISIK